MFPGRSAPDPGWLRLPAVVCVDYAFLQCLLRMDSQSVGRALREYIDGAPGLEI